MAVSPRFRRAVVAPARQEFFLEKYRIVCIVKNWFRYYTERMNYLPPSDVETLKSELSRLYERRLIVVELIRNLERYAASESGPDTVEAVNRPPLRVSSPLPH